MNQHWHVVNENETSHFDKKNEVKDDEKIWQTILKKVMQIRDRKVYLIDLEA